MRAKGYGSYRGRSPLKSFLKILLIVVIVLLVLGAAATFYLQQYLVVSADGVRLELPFFQADQDQDGSAPNVITPEAPITVVTPTPTPAPEPQALSPVALHAQALTDGTALSQIEAAGGDSALFDMKPDSSALNYASSIALAVSAKQSAADETLNAAIAALNETQGLYTIARVSCFKDHDITNYDRSLSVFTNSGYRWTDPEGIRWISPTNADVREYVTAVCVELAQLGFDEILLDNAGYPAEGNLHYIKKGEAYDSARFAEVVGGFYAQVASALGEYDVALSVVTTDQAMSGQDALTGQTPEDLALVDRLWIRGEDGRLCPVSGENLAP